jgi:hypothetical protein
MRAARGEISDGVDPDVAARFMTAAFQSFALQMEWDGQIEVEPYTPF